MTLPYFTPSRDRRTWDHAEVQLCEGHDFRPYTYTTYPGSEHTAWRCVWCYALTCGHYSYSEADPCWEPYHHSVPHRTRSGVVWPVGGVNPRCRS